MLSDSGGAAHDIHVYCHGEGDLPGPLPKATPDRPLSKSYLEAAAELLPKVRLFGLPKHTANTQQMLGFFSAESEVQDLDLDLAVQQALLKQ